MDEHQELYEAALTAITKLFSDTSVPQMITKENLESLKDEIDTMIDAIRGN